MFLKAIKLLSAAMFVTLISFTLAYGQDSEDENSLENSETGNTFGNSVYASRGTRNLDYSINQVTTNLLEVKYLEVGYSKPLGLGALLGPKSFLASKFLFDLYGGFSLDGVSSILATNQFVDVQGSFFGGRLKFPVVRTVDDAGYDKLVAYLTVGGAYGFGSCCAVIQQKNSYDERVIDFGVSAEIRLSKRENTMVFTQFKMAQGNVRLGTGEEAQISGTEFSIGVRFEL